MKYLVCTTIFLASGLPISRQLNSANRVEILNLIRSLFIRFLPVWMLGNKIQNRTHRPSIVWRGRFQKVVCILGVMLFICPAFAGQDSLTLVLVDSIAKHIGKGEFELAKQLIVKAQKSCADEADTNSACIRLLLTEADLAEGLGDYEKALKVIDRAINRFEKNRQAAPTLLAYILNSRALVELEQGKISKAKQTADSVYQFIVRDSRNLELKHQCLNLLARASLLQYKVHDAIDYYEQLMEVTIERAGPESILLARNYNNIANCFYQLRQHRKAIRYLQKAIRIQTKINGPDNFRSNIAHFNLGLNYSSNGSYDKAIHHFKESSRLIALKFPNHRYVADNHRSIGDAYFHLSDFEMAEKHYLAGLAVYQTLGDGYPDRANLIHSLAKLKAKKGKVDEALSLVDDAIEITEKTRGKSNPRVAAMTTNKVEYLMKLGRLEQAKAAGSKTLQILNYDPKQFDPEPIQFKGNLFFNLGTLGKVHLASYYKDHDQGELRRGLQYFLDGLKLIYFLRREMEDERSKHRLSQQSIFLYEGAVTCAYELFHTTDSIEFVQLALQLSEQSRQSSVLEALLSRSNEGFPGVPESILRKERELNRQISVIEDQIRKKKVDFKEEANRLRDSLFSVQLNLATFLDTLQENYTQYYDHRYQSSQVPVSTWQSELREGQIAVEFLDTEEFIYRFLITQGDLQCDRIPKSDSLQQQLSLFRIHSSQADSVLSNPIMSMKKLHQAGRALYDLLLKDLLAFHDVRELIILPDGLEANIVFEILRPSEDRYLFEACEIVYAQSLHFWIQQKRISSEPTVAFAGFAPGFSNPIVEDSLSTELLATIVRSGNFPLPASDQEVLAIQKIMGGQAYLEEEATRETIINQANRAQILHLSTHALLDEVEPAQSMFLLAGAHDSSRYEQLTAAEICHLELEAELAVLSACHTGLGKPIRGEGILSLGRAFAFAGVPSIIQSLWKVPDQSTAELMTGFYKGLKKGLRKHQALNFARAQYLDKTEIAAQRHPYFWAGFVLYGDAEAMSFKKRFPIVWTSIGLLFVLVMGRVIHRRLEPNRDTPLT